jgi:small-conductance mechanosensitive channel
MIPFWAVDFLNSILQLMETVAGRTVAAGVLFLAWVIILLVIKTVVFARIKTVAKKSSNRLDDVLVESLDTPLKILILASGAFLVVAIMALDPKIQHLLVVFLKACIVLAAALFGTRLVESLLKHFGDADQVKVLSKGITRGLVKAIIILLAILIFMDMIGVSITPILASLGIGSLAVALALQDTLANLFAGVQIVLDKPIRVGDFVKLESGEEGYIIEIGWRTTRVRMLPNNVVIVPNNKIISSVVTNYYFPAQDLAVLVQVGVHYSSDLRHVEKVTCEVGKEIMKTVPGAIPDFEPFIRYHTFGDSSINFTVILRAREFVDNYLIKHEFIKALHERYNREGITIPFPIRTLDISQETLSALRKN